MAKISPYELSCMRCGHICIRESPTTWKLLEPKWWLECCYCSAKRTGLFGSLCMTCEGRRAKEAARAALDSPMRREGEGN